MGRAKLKSFNKDDNYSIIPHSARAMGKDKDLLVIYWYLSQDAAFGTRFVRKELGGEEVSHSLEPGEVLTTMRGLAAEAGVDHKTAWRKVRLLQEKGFIESIRAINRYFSVIKVARPERGRKHEDTHTPPPEPRQTDYTNDDWESPDPNIPPDKRCANCEHYDFDSVGGNWCNKHDINVDAEEKIDPEQPDVKLPCEVTPEEAEAEERKLEQQRQEKEEIIKTCDACSWGQIATDRFNRKTAWCKKAGGYIKNLKTQCPKEVEAMKKKMLEGLS